MKIRPMGAELFHADGQTDMTKLILRGRLKITSGLMQGSKSFRVGVMATLLLVFLAVLRLSVKVTFFLVFLFSFATNLNSE
jgi:hypothetical protein